MNSAPIEQLSILHCVDSWIRQTENWLSRSILSQTQNEITVLTNQVLPGAPNPSSINIQLRKVQFSKNLNRKFLSFLWNKLVKILAPLERCVTAGDLKGRFDIAHSHFSVIGWEMLPLIKLMEIPHCVSFYGFDYERLPITHPVWRKRYQKLFKEVDAFVCEGHFGAKVLCEQGCPREKIHIARLGVDVGRIEFPSEAMERNNGIRLIQVATYTEKKGHKDSIDAFAKALPKLPRGSTLTLVGKDADITKAELMDFAIESGAASNILFIQGIDFSKLHSFLAGYHIFIHPSKYSRTRDSEGGAPVVLLDAQASGLPVISTTHCDIPDEVIHGETGFLAPEGDTNQIAENIVRLAALSDAEFQRMRLNARDHIEKNYSSSKNSEELQIIYSKLCGEPR